MDKEQIQEQIQGWIYYLASMPGSKGSDPFPAHHKGSQLNLYQLTRDKLNKFI
jgi:hypothetical protein